METKMICITVNRQNILKTSNQEVECLQKEQLSKEDSIEFFLPLVKLIASIV